MKKNVNNYINNLNTKPSKIAKAISFSNSLKYIFFKIY